MKRTFLKFTREKRKKIYTSNPGESEQQNKQRAFRKCVNLFSSIKSPTAKKKKQKKNRIFGSCKKIYSAIACEHTLNVISGE